MSSRHNAFSHRRGSLAGASAFLAAVAIASSAAASGPALTIEPAGPLAAGPHTITVRGAGFDPVTNGGNGVYVVFGPVTPAPGYYLDPSIYGAFKWVHPGAPDSQAEAPLANDGTFITTLDVSSVFSNPRGPVDCAVVACAIITFGAHGSQDRTQDTCVFVSFLLPASPAASADAAASEAPAQPSMVPPTAPDASATTTDPSLPADACAAIGAAA